jgi:putative transposase
MDESLDPRRKPNRSKLHDYSAAGAYFLTVCVEHRLPLLGSIVAGQSVLSEAGLIVERTILESRGRYLRIEVDVFCVMPDHFHLIAFATPFGVPGAISIPQYMNRLKSMMATRYRGLREVDPDLPVDFLQRSYWDRVLRDEAELELCRYYIVHNPLAFQIEKDRVSLIRNQIEEGRRLGASPTGPSSPAL